MFLLLLKTRVCRYAHRLEESSFWSTRVWPHGLRGVLIGAGTCLGPSGALAGTPAGELDREGWRSPCPTVLAGSSHCGHLEERKMTCLFQLPSVEPEAQSAARPSPLRWPLGTTPELEDSLWTIRLPALVEFMADPLPPGHPMTHTGQWIGTMDWVLRDMSPVHFVHSVATIPMDGNTS